ncbi:TfoX/Sxy family protein [Actibacterium sp. XHP0104]|uniref:TfoX/Sxy family protein n=1 Tax=Actibacterium sp. XHP0104 TaxID=2984335 RepID=UPI0021E7444C|nr:TfoX/Sxy family protein [Actibacterium sp. XHP0104]MCV2881430.1 TfoX/Sxy family protein [Actibacterium sp. XHP0104]
MTTPVSSIRNLGPAMQEAFERAGIHTAEELREMGADAGYARLLASGHSPHFIGYYALVMGLQGRPWNDCAGDEKKALRRRFDALKAASNPDTPPGIEKILNEIGVIPARKA